VQRRNLVEHLPGDCGRFRFADGLREEQQPYVVTQAGEVSAYDLLILRGQECHCLELEQVVERLSRIVAARGGRFAFNRRTR